jgi:hypothetical protein
MTAVAESPRVSVGTAELVPSNTILMKIDGQARA